LAQGTQTRAIQKNIAEDPGTLLASKAHPSHR